MVSLRRIALVIAGLSTVSVAYLFPPYSVRNEGVPVGVLKNVNGIDMYHSYPPGRNTSHKAILHITDIFGVPLLQNKLLADSFAANDYLVIMPDIFAGDAISVEQQEAGLNLTEWRTRHPPAAIDAIISQTLAYMRTELGVEYVGGVGYCFGGKYVPRFLTASASAGLDMGFIAHPSALTEAEIGAVEKPISIAAGTLDASFNTTAKVRAEGILKANNVTFQSNLYSGAPHGFGVRVNQDVPQQAYAKQASFIQAVTWFGAWL
ncbi:alpha/beta-hydrolase [Decorospora gaudefroyi]|uniref:Alpha/beta-hydrolase n=1 Tax=Decorospora gaudefroyi TaxID=184978 RepID=A0A6A5KRB3_9PLEO|nr:alpha/beta-hydrolase [Decorospora gaudefroyi]